MEVCLQEVWNDVPVVTNSLWAPAEISDAERITVATVAAHLLVADEHRDTPNAKTAEREFRKDGPRAFAVIVGLYTRGVAKTSRTSLDVSMVGGVEGALTRMASAAMDTCYAAREIDFGNRKFDGTAAVKLINGLVKLDQSVSEGDQLWAAVENFAGPLGLVRPEAPKRLDPEGCKFFKRIRDKILEYGQTGLEVRTVYNWFTGYRAEDGPESTGLTRRMAALGKVAKPSSGLTVVLEAKSDKDVAKVLVGLEVKERQALAKQLKAALGNKSQKPVRLSEFAPKTTTLFEQREIEGVVSEFKEYLSSQWQEGSYLKLEP